ncbi:MAG: NigD-like protein [Tannerella sp.]|nr:NigD-like protein [Tannerella sp.]
MKLLKSALCIVLAGLLLNACNDDGVYSMNDAWYSIATVNPLGDGAYSFTLDDGTTLWPAATDAPWYDAQQKQRVIVVYTILSDRFQGYDHAVKVLDIRNVLTKDVAKDLDEKNDGEYGRDPVKILNMWIGDGYLNVEFGFRNGGMGVVHYVNLVKMDNADTPYSYEFRHNAYGDNTLYAQKGMVAFDLSDIRETEEIELTVKINTFEGELEKKITFKPSGTAAETNVSAENYSADVK